MASGWRQDGVRVCQDGIRQASEVCQGSSVGVRSTSRCVRMRQEGVRVASGRRQDNLASGWRQDDVKRRGARINWTYLVSVWTLFGPVLVPCGPFVPVLDPCSCRVDHLYPSWTRV